MGAVARIARFPETSAQGIGDVGDQAGIGQPACEQNAPDDVGAGGFRRHTGIFGGFSHTLTGAMGLGNDDNEGLIAPT